VGTRSEWVERRYAIGQRQWDSSANTPFVARLLLLAAPHSERVAEADEVEPVARAQHLRKRAPSAGTVPEGGFA
jgi:hypothetical protein